MRPLLTCLVAIQIFLLSAEISGQPETVPDAVVASGDFDRVLVVRLKKGTDLLSGLEKAVGSENIRNAVILSGIGSLTDYHLHVVDNRTFPTSNAFFRDSIPVDLLSVNGYVFDGRIHAHVTISDEHRALGGHLEKGCRVFTFAILTLGVLSEEMDLAGFDDKYWH